jgi:outer membrane protein insertion porin family
MISTTTTSRRKSVRAAAVATTAMVAVLSLADAALAQQGGQGNRRAGAETTTRSNSVINRVVFQGNRRVERAILEQEVQTRARVAFSPQVAQADVQRILEIYRRTGRGLAQVTYQVVALPNGRQDVIFNVVEGDKTGVREIRFVGNNAISASRLRGVMTTSEMNLLSFFKNNDVYDPDRIAADQELIRRYYLKNGYADFRIVQTDVQFDAARGGYVITMAVEEGPQYRIGGVRVDSRIPEISGDALAGRVSTSVGAVYNAEAVERSLQNMTTEVARRGYAFAQVRPVGTRDPATQTIQLGYVVEEGPRVYIERINVRGNTRTRDYVIRREFDLGEGDAYNKVLVDRAERRLNALGYFKRVRVTNEPGSSPDRVVVNVDVEDQSTGSFSLAGGYSTADGFIGEVSVTESNFLGRGQYVRVAGQYGQRAQGVDFSFTEPYFLGYRLAAGFDLFSKFTDQTRYSRYENRITGGQLRLGLPFSDELGVTLRYSLFQQELTIPNTAARPYNDCTVPIQDFTSFTNCESNGEASIAIKEAAGTSITSLIGATVLYNTLDNPKEPRNGFYAELKPDIAGLGGDARFFRVTGDGRYFYELMDDVVGIARVQGGHIMGFGGHDLRILDHFFMGPSLVRGFASSGIGPRDVSLSDSQSNAIGGTTYVGTSLEVQFPIFGLPRELGLKGAVFADAGTLFGYKGKTRFDVNRNGILEGTAAAGCEAPPATSQSECILVKDSKDIRSSVGASLLWASPLGPIRFDYAVALSKAEGDRTQAFRFSGGTRF